jgi:hypothetical protein
LWTCWRTLGTMKISTAINKRPENCSKNLPL